nr:hypothetical protein [Paracoccus saliphilus]
MTDKIMVLGAFIVLVGFLGILVWHVPRLDLGAIVLLTLVLAAVDIAQSTRSRG